MGKIAVVFPGIGYHKDKPLLYYSTKLAREAGYQPAYIDFSTIPWDKSDLSDPGRMKDLFTQAMENAEKTFSGISVTDGDELLFISKSIGTVVSACYAARKGIKASQIYFSPVEAFGQFAPDHGLAFYGDNDPLADHTKIEEICATKKIEAHRIPGGNHSLETGDTEKDLKSLSEIMGLIKAFI